MAGCGPVDGWEGVTSPGSRGEDPGSPIRRLPSGPNRLPAEEVARDQRRRILAGAARMLARHKFEDVTVERITSYAQVSRSTFYENFKNRQDCIETLYKEIFEGLMTCLVESCRAEPDGPAKAGAAISAAVSYLAARPDEASVLLLDARLVSSSVVERARARLISALRETLGGQSAKRASPAIAELATIGAISAVVSNFILVTEPTPLDELLPELVFIALLPYTGPDEARRNACRLNDHST
jgi:AcrR family transcriptional regulator